jgi:hypothetical protein
LQAAKTTLFAAGNEANVRKKRRQGDFFPIDQDASHEWDAHSPSRLVVSAKRSTFRLSVLSNTRTL